MFEKKSKYHSKNYVGKNTEDPTVNEFGYKYMWNSSHEDLEPSTTFNVGNGNYCVYCRAKAYPIQAGLKGNGRDYTTTGYTCICESAETEKQFKKEQEELMKKHSNEYQELKQKFAESLKINKVEILKMKQKAELQAEQQRSKYSSENYFTSVNGSNKYYNN
jgi:hypothetical protein